MGRFLLTFLILAYGIDSRNAVFLNKQPPFFLSKQTKLLKSAPLRTWQLFAWNKRRLSSNAPKPGYWAEQIPEQADCGVSEPLQTSKMQQDAVEYVVGGSEAPEGRYPWMVQVLAQEGPSGEEVFCAGALISSHWVLTAKHCVPFNAFLLEELGVSSVDPPVFVVTGRETGEISAQRLHKVKEIQLRLGSENDIALLKLELPINVTAICLPSPDDVNQISDRRPEATESSAPFKSRLDKSKKIRTRHGFHSSIPVAEHCYQAGWGYTDTSTLQIPTVLQSAKVQVVDLKHCTTIPLNIKPNLHMCATGRATACAGDSGAPLMCSRAGRLVANGMVIKGKITEQGPICGSNAPVLYLKVTAYLQWIVDVLTTK